jgi:hypothetical protein
MTPRLRQTLQTVPSLLSASLAHAQEETLQLTSICLEPAIVIGLDAPDGSFSMPVQASGIPGLLEIVEWA